MCNRLREPTLEVMVTSQEVSLGALHLSMYSSTMLPFKCKLDHTVRTCINGDLDSTDRGRDDDGNFYMWRDQKFGKRSRKKEKETSSI